MIEFNICHNDDNGNATANVYKIIVESFNEIDMELEPNDFISGELLRFDFKNNLIIFPNNYYVKFLSMSAWAGNMHWNLYRLTDHYGLGFLYLLQQSNKWHCVSGETDLFNKWNAGGEILAADLQKGDLVKKYYIIPEQQKLFNSIKK